MVKFSRILMAFAALGLLVTAALAIHSARAQETIGPSNLNLGSSTNLGAGAQGNKGILVAPVGDTSVVSAPAAATAASASVAAGGAAVRHVATQGVVCISPVAAQGDIIFNLRDGATGAGTVKATWRLASPAGQSKCEYLESSAAVVGSLNTAMTLESAAAPAATNFATATLFYHDTQ